MQNELARAHASEDTLRTQTRETMDAQTRRIAELERQLLHARGDDVAREDEVYALRAQKVASQEEIETARGTIQRLEIQLATAETHRSKAEEAERAIAHQQSALRESEAAIKADAAQLRAMEAEKREQGAMIRELISTAEELKRRRDWLEEESRELRGALQEAARRHEEAMAAADKTVRQVRAAAEGKVSRELQLRLAKLQARVTELAEKEQRVLLRQSAMAEELATARVTAETEYSRRVEIERALHQSANIFKQQIWTKEEELARVAEEARALREKLGRSKNVEAVALGRDQGGIGGHATGGAETTTLRSSTAGGGGYGEDELSRLRLSREEYQREMLEQNKLKVDLLGKIASEMGLGPPVQGDRGRAQGEGEGEGWGRNGVRRGGGGGDDSIPGPAWTDEAVSQLNEAIGALDETLGTGEDAAAAAGDWASRRDWED